MIRSCYFRSCYHNIQYQMHDGRERRHIMHFPGQRIKNWNEHRGSTMCVHWMLRILIKLKLLDILCCIRELSWHHTISHAYDVRELHSACHFHNIVFTLLRQMALKRVGFN